MNDWISRRHHSMIIENPNASLSQQERANENVEEKKMASHHKPKLLVEFGHFHINGSPIVRNVKGETLTQLKRVSKRKRLDEVNMHEWSDTKHHERNIY